MPLDQVPGDIPRLEPQDGPQLSFLSTTAQIAIYGGAAGGGKLLRLDCPIPTPSGWEFNGDLKAGDYVLNEKGEPCLVLAAYDPEKPKAAYRFTFDDGSNIDAGCDHLWKTFNIKELAQLTRLSSEWRKERQRKRPSRASGNKSEFFTKIVSERNKTRNYVYKELPTGTVRSSEEIYKTLRVGNRSNHAIRISEALFLRKKNLLIDPYLFGVWLGDGTSREGHITCADPIIRRIIRKKGYVIYPIESGAPLLFAIKGLTTKLRLLGVKNNKHIPIEYLRSSFDQRLELLKGLMDSDGTAKKGSGVSFSNCNRRLAEDVYELIVSLGFKASFLESRAKLYEKDCGPAFDISFSPDIVVFNLIRKATNQRLGTRRTNKFRYIVDCQPIDPVPMRCITVDNPTGMFLAGRQMVPTHNSWALLFEALRNVTRNRRFSATIFRRTTVSIRRPGSLWDESMAMYGQVKGARPTTHNLEWHFEPHGGKVVMAHLEYDNTVLEWHASQLPYIGFDELTEFSQYQFWYMLSRNRSMCGVLPYIRATCNPDANSWVAELISWWIDQQTGYPIPERSGVVRWFLRVGDEIVWREHPRFLTAARLGLPTHDRNGREIPYIPKSLTFIPSDIYDNKLFLQANPEYLANLMALPTVERERLLRGNWKIKPAAGLYFKREWVKIVQPHQIPSKLTIKRGWDLAATEKTQLNSPDWTCGTKIGKDETTGNYYILHHTYIQKSPSGVESHMRLTASGDGRNVTQEVPQDPGQAGKWQTISLRKALDGYPMNASPETGDKGVRFGPFSSIAQTGKVFVLAGDWNERWFSTLEGFDPEDDNCISDDADSTSRGYNAFLDASTGIIDYYKRLAQEELKKRDAKYAEPDPSELVKVRSPDPNVNMLYNMRGQRLHVDADGLFLVTREHAEFLRRSGFVTHEAEVIDFLMAKEAVNG